MPSSSASIIVLAGGESRRMGRDKAQVRLGGVPLLRRVVDAVGGAGRDWVVVTNRAEVHRSLLAPLVDEGGGLLKLVSDRRPGAGPLAGLEAGFEAAAGDRCFVVACDLPFVTADLATDLLDRLAASEADAVLPRTDAHLQPLCAAYRRSVHPAVQAALDAGTRSLRGFLDTITPLVVDAASLASVADPDLTFLNVNRPDALLRAQTLAAPPTDAPDPPGLPADQ